MAILRILPRCLDTFLASTAMLTYCTLSEEPDPGLYEAFTLEEVAALRSLALSKEVYNRKLCAEWLKWGVSLPDNKPLVLELADHLIPDQDQDIRWGILAIALNPILGDWAPEALWPLVVKWGSVRNKDIRNGIGICVLEDILRHNFDEYFSRSKQIIESGNRFFGFTLSCCGKFGQAKEPANAEAFDAFISSLSARRPIRAAF